MGAIMGCLQIYSFTLILWELMSLEICSREDICPFKLVATAYGNKRRLPIKKTWPKAARRLIQKGLNVDSSKRPNAVDIHEELNFFIMCKNNAVIATLSNSPLIIHIDVWCAHKTANNFSILNKPAKPGGETVI